MPQLSDNSYLAIKTEAQAGVAVIPDIFIPLVSESVKTVSNYIPDRRMKGIDWKSNELLKGNRTHEGEVVVMGDADAFAHFLNMVLLLGSTTGDATEGYTHPFTVGTPQSYTFEIKKGLYAQRYIGVLIDELKLEFVDQLLQMTAVIKAQAQFSISSVGVALTGAGMVSLTLDDNYDISPNRGLVIGDVITVGGIDITLTGVDANGRDVAFASIEVTAAVGDPVYLKAQIASLSTVQDPLCFGNLLVGLGEDESAATTAAGSRATATPVYDLKISIKNNLFNENGTNRIDPFQILPRTKEAQIEVKQLFETVEQRQKYLDITKQAMTIKMFGKNINPDFSTSELVTLIFNKIKLIENDNAIEVGEFINDAQVFEVLYDNSDAQAMEAEVINNTAGTEY